MGIYVNRILNMKSIKAVGFDMDFTLVRYHTNELEKLSHKKVIEKLIKSGYPEIIKELKFDFNQCIRGLVLDKEKGNILKLSHYSKVKSAFHGTTPMNFRQMQQEYKGLSIDLNDDNYYPIDTFFSLAHGTLFAQLVDLKDQEPDLFPQSYKEIEAEILFHIDMCHRDGSIKDEITSNLPKYIIKDEKIVRTLERLKKHGKLLWLITNSDFFYTQKLMEFTFNPFLPKGTDWKDLFDVSITFSRKPSFFTNNRLSFLKVNPDNGLMSNTEGPFRNAVFQYGNATTLEKEFGVSGEEILYLGDHIYGDILTLKKACNWRTALVIEELEDEVNALKKIKPLEQKVEAFMSRKEDLENLLDKEYIKKPQDHQAVKKLFAEIDQVDLEVRKLLDQMNTNFNAKWGELMRAGAETSRFAGQVEKYACIYMSNVSDLFDYSARKYFRPPRRLMPHDQ